GDVTWETSYGLPGEGLPPRVQADLTLDWPTWAQTAYRSWYVGEPFNDPPRIEIELVIRVQRLAEAPDPKVVLAVLPETSAPIGTERLERSGPTIETVCSADLEEGEYAIEESYEGSYELDEAALEDGSILDHHRSAMGGRTATTQVRSGALHMPSLALVQTVYWPGGPADARREGSTTLRLTFSRRCGNVSPTPPASPPPGPPGAPCVEEAVACPSVPRAGSPPSCARSPSAPPARATSRRATSPAATTWPATARTTRCCSAAATPTRRAG